MQRLENIIQRDYVLNRNILKVNLGSNKGQERLMMEREMMTNK